MTSVLTAVSYHQAVRSVQGNLTVQAVFDRAWHLSHRDGQVLTVAAVPYDGPMAVRLDRQSLVGLPIELGMRARLEGDCLVAGSVRIDLVGASVWPPLAMPAPPILPEALLRDLSTIARHVHSNERQATESAFQNLARVGRAASHCAPRGPALRGFERDSTSAWLCRAEKSMAGLHDALVCSEVSAAREHCRSLLGLGPGLTPTGDDIVIGVLAALHILGRRMGTEGAKLAQEIGLGLAKEGDTTPLSRTLLAWAAQGVAAQPLLDVLLTLGGKCTVSDIGALLAIGHSSGRDMLTGAHLAASAILAREERRDPAMAGQA